MSDLELDEHPAGVGGKYAEKGDDDDTRDHAHGGQAGGEGQHAIADNLGDHQDGYELPRQRLVMYLRQESAI